MATLNVLSLIPSSSSLLNMESDVATLNMLENSMQPHKARYESGSTQVKLKIPTTITKIKEKMHNIENKQTKMSIQ